MTADEVNDKLKSLRFNPVKNGWTHKDTHGDETYGLNFTKVQQLAREITNDPCLADELYASSNHDLKVLATFIDDPKSYTRDELEKRSAQLYPSPFSEKFCQNVLARTEHAVQFIDKWSRSQEPAMKIYAYDTLAEVAKNKNNLSPDFFGQYLELISSDLDNESEPVKVAMCKAFNAIGHRDEKLLLKCAHVTGHGETKSETLKTLQRSKSLDVLIHQ
jgi:replicative superfamily II helicase